jgi:hypothetical protein
VSLRTSIEGGVSYARRDLDVSGAVVRANDGAQVTRWETIKITVDPQEHAEAVKVRAAARALVTGVTIASEFGQLCPLTREQALTERLARADDMVREYNSRARTCRVTFASLRGRIASDDGQAERAVAGEVRALLASLDSGIRAADPEAIRAAASKAKGLAAMLTDTASERVSAAVREARDAAIEITKRIVKGGEVAETVLAEIKTEAIRTASACFLDMDAPAEPVALPAPAVSLDVEAAPVVPETVAEVAAPLPEKSRDEVAEDARVYAASGGALPSEVGVAVEAALASYDAQREPEVAAPVSPLAALDASDVVRAALVAAWEGF